MATKPKKKIAPPPDEAEGWVVSYADLMSVICCFFILMMAFANYEEPGFSKKVEELGKSFRGEFTETTTDTAQEVMQEIARHDLKDRLKVSFNDGELRVTFSTSLVYQNAQTALDDSVKETLDALIDILKITNDRYRILIEGHADDDLAKTPFRNQWELSLLRAADVASRFEYFGFDPKNIVPIGRGDNQKLHESFNRDMQRDESIARSNRRVVIRVLEPVKKEKIKMGLGVYFRDAVEEVKEDEIKDIEREQFNLE